ncbi:hypothetical protein Ddc_08441 [Ditylenchus destructor]|nr:hypothetical protein Ddc_08441 [Ditylenchus destructor]
MNRFSCLFLAIIGTSMLTSLVLAAPSPNLLPATSTMSDSSKSSTQLTGSSLYVSDVIPQEYAPVASFIPWQYGHEQQPGKTIATTSGSKSGNEKRQQRADAITASSEVYYTSNYNSPADERQSRPDSSNIKPDSFVISAPTEVRHNQDSLLLPPSESVVPKMTGGFVKSGENKWGKTDNFAGPITNPAAYYLEGANLDEIKPPKCRMIGCDGPMPNDFDFSLQQDSNMRNNQACHQTFVPLNGCLDGRGYPTGMVCTICCDCTADFSNQMRKSRGYIQGYKA